MAGTTESTDPAPANPDEAAPSKSRGEDAKPPAEDVKPPLLFVGRTFHIASTFPEWYDSKLKQDIQVTPFTAQQETSSTKSLQADESHMDRNMVVPSQTTCGIRTISSITLLPPRNRGSPTLWTTDKQS
jgi:hypothetical protein